MAWSLQENVGATDAMEPIPVGEGIRPIPVPALPPYNGFGSFEDSEQSCKNLVSPAPFLPAALACLSAFASHRRSAPPPACLSVCLSVRTLGLFSTATLVLMTSAQLLSMICDQTAHHVTSLVNVWSSYRTDGLPHDIHAMLSLRITDVQHDLNHLTHNQKGLWLFCAKNCWT